MIKFNLILLLVFVIGINAGKIIQLQSLTSRDADAEMNGELDLVVCAGTFGCCLITTLDNEYDNFESGVLDVFAGQYLQGCFNFEVTDDTITTLLVSHRGEDAWLGEWFRILFDDGRWVQCDIPDWLDNEDELNLMCK
jgi:hypothetical protein